MLVLNAEQQVVAYLIQSGFTASFMDGATSALVFFIALALATAFSTSIVAKSKGRSVLWWTSLALLIPVIPLLLIWRLPVLPSHE